MGMSFGAGRLCDTRLKYRLNVFEMHWIWTLEMREKFDPCMTDWLIRMPIEVTHHMCFTDDMSLGSAIITIHVSAQVDMP